MRKLMSRALPFWLSTVLPFSAFAGMPSDPITPMLPPHMGEVAYDMAIVRQDMNGPTATLVLGHANVAGEIKATLNGQTGTLTVQRGSGQTYSFTFQQIASRNFPNNLAAQSAFIVGLNDLTTNRESFVSLNSYSNRSGIEFGEGLIDYHCAFVPCREIHDPYTDHWASSVYIDWYPPPGPWYQGLYAPELISYDMERWRQQVQQACGRAHTVRAAGSILAHMGGTAAACFSSQWGGLTAGACAAGAGQTLERINSLGNDDYICHRSGDQHYPGPGKW